MSRKIFLALLGFFIAGLTALPASTFAATATPANSTLVAGYQLTAGTGDNITGIKASWLVPEVTCTGTETSYSNVSIMIDGFASPKTDQLRIGTTSNCVAGKATYGVFYVLNLASGTTKVVKPLPATVSPGDLIKVTATWNPGGAPKHGGSTNQGWRATLTDVTSGATGKLSDKSKTKAALNSAAFVVGKPAGAQLADFDSAGFGNTYTTVRNTCELTAGFSNHTVFNSISIGSLGNQKGFTLTQYTMVYGLDVLATAGPLDTKGKSFSVSFNAAS